MDTEGELFAGDDMFTAQVTKVSTPSGWDEVQRIAEENSLFILAEFRQEFCRKCMAIAPRFRKLPALLAGRSVMVVEVDAMKLGKPGKLRCPPTHVLCKTRAGMCCAISVMTSRNGAASTRRDGHQGRPYLPVLQGDAHVQTRGRCV
eukprot:2754274-Rhodomonas_salina.2